MNAAGIQKVFRKGSHLLIVIVFLSIPMMSLIESSDYEELKKEWVEASYSNLSNREKAGQLTWFSIPCQEESTSITSVIRKYNPSGIVLNSCSYAQLKSLSPTLRSLEVMIAINRSQILDAPEILPNPLNIPSFDASYQQIIQNEKKLLGVDIYLDQEKDVIEIFNFNGNEKSLKKYISQNDVLLLNSNMGVVFQSIEDIIEQRDISEKLLENKVKKILELNYDLNNIAKSSAPITNNEFVAEVNQFNEVSFHTLYETKIDELSFQLELNDYVAIINESSFHNNTFNIFKSHIPYSFEYFDKSSLPKNYRSHFTKIIHFTDRPDTTTNWEKNMYLNVHAFGNSKLEYNFYFPHNDQLFYEELIESLLPQTNRNSIIKKNRTPEEVNIESVFADSVLKIATDGIQRNAFPGCRVLVSRKGKIIHDGSYGYLTYDSLFAVDENTIYDLASVTKVASTTLSLMKLYEEGKLDLNRKASYYLPEMKGTDKEDIIIKDLLLHQSGLRSYFPFWKISLDDKRHYYKSTPDELNFFKISPNLYAKNSLQDSVWQWVLQSPMINKEEKETFPYRYSDLGFFILKKVVEEITDVTIDEYVNTSFYEPLGIFNLTYNPLCKTDVTNIAPTENDIMFRKELLVGNVHDRNASLNKGVDGHAGLFGDAFEVSKLLQMLIQEGSYGGIQFLKPETIEIFTSSYYKGNRRGLGWDKPALDNHDNTSDYASMLTYGHTGFTGTSIWVDPKYDLTFVFLSNRVYPNASNKKLMELGIRERIHDAVYTSINNN